MSPKQDLTYRLLTLPFDAALIVPVGAFVLIIILLQFWNSPIRRLRYPPGPEQTSFISGNLSNIPTTKLWLTYTDWAKEFGTVVHYRLYNQHTIIVSSMEDCVELFEKAPTYTLTDQTMGWGFNVGLMRYGAKWRSQRRMFQQSFKRDVSLIYQPIQVRKVNDMLYGLLTSPDDSENIIKPAIVMSTTYDYDISPKQDYFVSLSEAAIARLGESYIPGVIVNFFPILRFLPSSLPGAGFKRYAYQTRQLVKQMREIPLQFVEDNLATENTSHCLAATYLRRCKSSEEYTAIQDFTSVSYGAGADTTTSAIGTFFYAMTLFPEAQKKAQDELDMVIGPDRIPGYDDRSSLPYVEALFREVLRWRPVTPLGVAHAISDDDVYKGWLIPKGATVIANIWAIAHDPHRYQAPESFNPDRFFDSDGELNKDEVGYAFGFGRRVCPGRHMAASTVWLTIATVLSTFHIRKKKDAFGAEISVSGEYTDGMMSHPPPFQCSITPRLSNTERVIVQALSQTKND